MHTRTLVLGLAPWLPLWIATGCGRADPPSSTAAIAHTQPAAALQIDPIDTFILDSIQIDALAGGPGDANLFKDEDPADHTQSANLPAGGPGAYIDWEDLASDLDNHRLVDTDDEATGRDLSAFPGSDECVGPANVLSKMDLVYAGVASNTQYVYLAVLRTANNGDAGYYWLFTRNAPRMLPGDGPCSAWESRLLYDISGPDLATGAAGDVLVRGHFKPSAEPLLQAYSATRDQDGVPATDAIDYLSSLWQLNPTGVAAAAVNVSPTAPGAWGADDVKSMVGPNLAHELFAEAAVPLSMFSGGSSCGASYWGSVITRSSGAGGTSPDLKDLVGPQAFNFGSLTIDARTTPTCTLNAGFDLVSATGLDGQEIVSPTCSWTFSDGGSATTCDGTHTFATPGTYHGTITVSDAATGCTRDFTTPDVRVYAPLSATASFSEGCTAQFGYGSTFAGGSGEVGYAWTFGGVGPVTPATSSAASGTVGITVGGNYGADLVVTDLRSDGPVCTAPAHAEGRAYPGLSVSLHRDTDVLTCTTGLATDAVTYLPVPSGGNGDYTYTWNGYACSGASCTVDPPDSNLCVGVDLSVTLSDSSGLCPPATSETESYAKTTIIDASDH